MTRRTSKADIAIDVFDAEASPEVTKPANARRSELQDNPTAAPGAALASQKKSADVRTFEFGDSERELATELQVNIAGPVAVRLHEAIDSTNRALRLVIGAGLQLLSIRAECAHGEFEPLLEGSGMPRRRAFEAMTYARFAASLPEAERAKVLALPKSKVLELAQADPEVIQQLFDDDDKFDDLADLSVRGLRLKIRELQAKNADLAVERETAQTELEMVQTRLRELQDGRVKTGGTVPPDVQDFRLESAALAKKAELAIDDLERQFREQFNRAADDEWNTPLARHLYGSVALVIHRAAALASQLETSFGIEAVSGGHTSIDYLSPPEILQCAREFKELLAEHDHEKTLRAWEREMDRPKGRGRPKAKPTKA